MLVYRIGKICNSRGSDGIEEMKCVLGLTGEIGGTVAVRNDWKGLRSELDRHPVVYEFFREKINVWWVWAVISEGAMR